MWVYVQLLSYSIDQWVWFYASNMLFMLFLLLQLGNIMRSETVKISSKFLLFMIFGLSWIFCIYIWNLILFFQFLWRIIVENRWGLYWICRLFLVEYHFHIVNSTKAQARAVFQSCIFNFFRLCFFFSVLCFLDRVSL